MTSTPGGATPFEHRRDIQLFGDLADRWRGLPVLHHRGPGDDLQSVDLREMRQDVIVDPVHEERVLLECAPVGERQDGDGAQVDGGRLGDGRLATALGAGTEQHPASGHHTPQSECRYAARDRVPPRKEPMLWAFL